MSFGRYLQIRKAFGSALPGLSLQNYELSSSAMVNLIVFSAQWSQSSFSTFTSFFIFFSPWNLFCKNTLMHLSLSLSLWNYSSLGCIIERCPITPMGLEALWITPTWEKCFYKKHWIYVKKVQRLFSNPGSWYGQAYKGKFLYMQAANYVSLATFKCKNALMQQALFNWEFSMYIFIGFSSSET